MLSLTLIYFLLILLFLFLLYIYKVVDQDSMDSTSVDNDEERIHEFLVTCGGNHVSHLIYLHDKKLYWAQKNQVLIAYKTIFNRAIVLGDPIGDSQFFQAAIREFHVECQNNKLKPIFYQVSPKYMHMYHENGYRFMKLGEEGLVNLKSYSLDGKQGAKLRTKFNKFSRDGYTFSVLKPPYSSDLLSEIRQVSDSWLGDQKEKGFSVVSFSEEYVSRSPIALLFDRDKNIVAFVTLATDFRETIIIDLMRKLPITPHGTMEVLFIHIMKWAHAHHYTYCSLGMTPLSNVGNTEQAFLTEKILRYVFLYGNSSYNTKGLKEFKRKFACEWEPKYLAYNKTFLPFAFIQLFFVIHNPPVQPNVVVKRIKLLLRKAS